MRNPFGGKRKRTFLGGDGMRLLWKAFPQAAFFEVFVPVGEDGTTTELPLIVESTEARLVEPYTKMFYRLFTARDEKLTRLLFLNVNCSPAVSRRVAANLAITLASEEFVTYLVELDMIDPAIHKIFHVNQKPGVVEFLLKGASANDIVRETGVPELKLIPSGKLLSDPGEILSILGWSDTLERMIPRGAVSLFYVGSGKSFKLDEFLAEVDGTILLFSSGEMIDRAIKKDIKRIKKRSDVVGVIWTNPMEYPSPGMATLSYYPRSESDREIPEEERVPVVEARYTSFEGGESFEPTGDIEYPGGGPRREEEESPLEGGSGEGSRDEGVTWDGAGEKDSREEVGSAGAVTRDENPLEEADEDIPGEDLETDDRVVFASSEIGEEKRSTWLPVIGAILGILVLWALYNWLGSPGTEAPEEVAVDEIALSGETAGEASSGEETVSGRDVPTAVAGGGTQTNVEGIAPAKDEGKTPTIRKDEGILNQSRIEAKVVKGYSLAAESEVPYSLVLASYRDASSADKGRETLERAGFDAYIVPVEIPGLGRWSRLMVGQYRSSEEAAAELAVIKEKSRFDQGRIIRSNLAYFLGAFGSRDEAQEISDRVGGLGLDTYVLTSGTGGEIYLLYLGAFESEKQAVVAGEMLDKLSLKRELVERKGLGL